MIREISFTQNKRPIEVNGKLQLTIAGLDAIGSPCGESSVRGSTGRSMPFSRSTFTVDINGVAIFVFQAKRHSEAEEVCREWTAEHLSELLARNFLESDAPPSINVRIAHADERSAYETANAQVASEDDVTLVYLVNFVS
ncbi:hypothetical protein [Bradyrhizobium valentinum]|uniref:hypothetical protein n=1 Tax=Bradyrhizobium valentinum TaxID=1518501 RepID=UPI0012E3A6AB|nr:hypothetical protein [Bradyrhizobium valentinum]